MSGSPLNGYRVAMLVSNPCDGDARVIKMAESIAGAGAAVLVCATARQDVPAYEIKNGVTYVRAEWSGARYILQQVAPRKYHKYRVIRHLASLVYPFAKYRFFSSLMSTMIKNFQPHVIHAHDLICLPAASEIASRCDSKVIYDAHELEVHRNPPLPFFQRQYVKLIERHYGRRADGVITVGDAIAGILRNELKREDIDVVYNAPRLSALVGKNIKADAGIQNTSPCWCT